ncbi:MAG TPA: hypothetical protein VGW34_11325 [Allosphingosinicella sp.]|nr:hypothetical protein [Allosphingosinicella sp.]
MKPGRHARAPRLALWLAAVALAGSAPSAAAAPPAAAGLIELGGGATAYVPAGAAALPPVLVLLHGAGRGGDEMVRRFQAEADRRGILLVAPKSLGPTWDIIPALGALARADAGPAASRIPRARAPEPSVDPPRIEAALAALGARIGYDRGRVGLAGFSDGASYALSYGTSRPRLFSAILAFSPGVIRLPDRTPRGQRVFVAHGRQDRALAFATTSAGIVPALRAKRLAVTFRPFQGGHEIPDDVAAAGLDFFLGGTGR